MERYEDLVFRFLLRKTTRYSDAEDLLQQCFLLAYRKLHLYRTDLPFGAWILTLARNLAAGKYRKDKQRQALREKYPDDLPRPSSPEMCMATGDAVHIWETARAQLNPESFDALYLAYQEDWSMEQIATALKCRVNRVKVMLHRARKKLEPHLIEHRASAQPGNTGVCAPPLYQQSPS